MKKQLLLLFAIFVVGYCQAQVAKRRAPSVLRTDTAEVSALLQEFVQNRFKDTVKAKQVLQKADSVALKSGDNLAMARVDYWKCMTQLRREEEKRAACLTGVLHRMKASNGEPYMAEVLNSIASAYGVLSLTSKKTEHTILELEHYFQSLELLKKYPNDRLKAFALFNVGGTYFFANSPKSIEYYEASLKANLAVRDTIKMSSDFSMMAGVHAHFKQHIKAIEYAKIAIWAVQQQNDKKKEGYLQSNLALLYLQLSDEERQQLHLSKKEVLNLAYQHAGKSLALLNEKGVPPAEALTPRIRIAEVYMAEEQYEKAAVVLQELTTLLRNIRAGHEKIRIVELLSTLYSKTAKYDSAYYYTMQLPALRDSVSINDLQREILRKELEYGFSKKQESLNHEKRINEEKLQSELLLSQQRQKELQLKQALLSLSFEQKAFADLAFQKATTDLQVQQASVGEKQKQLLFAQREKTLQQNEMALRQQHLLDTEQELRQKKKQRWLIIGLVTLFLLFSFLVFRSYRNKQRAKELLATEQQKAQRSEAVRRMAELEMHGLRAQLNPHFMFNSLNAIQEQILKENTDNAGTYLTTFARMLRQLLENAENSFVPLSKELDFLRHYLSMEQLRIPELTCNIYIDPAISLEDTTIPNMVLQPYLENAIWHGLSPKVGDKQIWLRIQQTTGGVQIEITDNGIGRKKAAERKSLYRRSHQSKGMELLYKRFDLIGKEFGETITVSIVDLYEGNDAAGTTVRLLVPDVLTEQKTERQLA